VVNGRTIGRESFARFTAAVAAERKSVSLDTATRRRLLERMLDEELLLQRGVALDLHRLEHTARRSIVAALVASVTADAELVEPDEETLREFYAENSDLFARPGRLVLAAAFVDTEQRPDPVARREAEEIARRVRAGEPLEQVRSALADLPVAELPQGWLSLETIRQYLGPSAASAAARLAVGEVSDPIRASSGYWVLELRDRNPGEVAPFEQIRSQVRSEHLRSRGDAALREYLAGLRESAEIRILDPELAAP
jgi:parvulin-like peptidyl-prolyl isomerase